MDIAEPFLKSLTEKRKEWLIGASSVIAGVAILIGYFLSGPSALNYAEAQSAFAQWEATPEDEQLYRSMREAIHSVPSLEQKYAASMAQILLNTNRLEEALEVAGQSLNRVQEEAPFHATFAQTSLLIEGGDYQKALESAVALKEQMGPAYLSESKGGSLLYAHNLLRIACLQQELKNRPGEKAAWEEFETLLKANPNLSHLVLANFTDHQVDLNHYIADRKKAL